MLLEDVISAEHDAGTQWVMAEWGLRGPEVSAAGSSV